MPKPLLSLEGIIVLRPFNTAAVEGRLLGRQSEHRNQKRKSQEQVKRTELHTCEIQMRGYM
jgi:hypothetical protein